MQSFTLARPCTFLCTMNIMPLLRIAVLLAVSWGAVCGSGAASAGDSGERSDFPSCPWRRFSRARLQPRSASTGQPWGMVRCASTRQRSRLETASTNALCVCPGECVGADAGSDVPSRRVLSGLRSLQTKPSTCGQQGISKLGNETHRRARWRGIQQTRMPKHSRRHQE